MTRAVLFDLDGTLLDTLEDIADAMNRVLQALGFDQHELGPYRRFVGDGVRMLVKRALPAEAREPDVVEQGVALMKQSYGDRLFVKTKPYAGIPELLDQLQRRDLILAVLSNKLHEPTRALVQHFFGLSRFGRVLGQRDGVPRKPNPTAALEIASELDIPPSDWLFLGDTSTDMRTARAAGMTAIGVTWGFRSAEELRAHGASHVVDEPLELCKLALTSSGGP